MNWNKLIIILSVVCIVVIYSSLSMGQSTELLYEGIAEDKQDYIIRHHNPYTGMVYEDHYKLVPHQLPITPSGPAYQQEPFQSLHKDLPTDWGVPGAQREYRFDYNFHQYKHFSR